MDDIAREAHDHREMLRQIARQAMVDYGLWPEFSREAIAETERAAAARTARRPEPVSAVDLRELSWCSIDNDDSLDLDQLSTSEALPGGAVRVRVAIADVDDRVRTGGAVDQHARQNTTSVYTPAEIFPMLPERFSTDLTSLAFGEERRALVVEFSVGADGLVSDATVFQALVANRAKLAYNAVAAWLDGEAPAPAAVASVPGLADDIRRQHETATRLRRSRLERGALDFQTIEARPVFEGGAVRALSEERDNCARNLIEDFMIAANTATVRFLESKGVPSIRRVVRSPERWDRIEALASGYGVTLPPEPDSKALADFLARRRAADAVRFPDLCLAVIKLLGAGEYVVERPHQAGDGHFGLAVKDYGHSTAPNRRFPDLVTQRLIKAALAGAPVPYSEAELDAIAAHCTDMEDEAHKVERLTRKAAAALLLESRIGSVFDAIVTGASPKGTWVRVFAPPVEGRLERGFEGLDVGDRVRVRLIHTDARRGFIDFAKA